MTKLEQECLDRGELAAALLRAGCKLDTTGMPKIKKQLVTEAELKKSEEDGKPSFQLESFPLLSILTADHVEEALLGLLKPFDYNKGHCKGTFHGIFNHPHALKIGPPPDVSGLVDMVLAMCQLLRNHTFLEPWVFIHPRHVKGEPLDEGTLTRICQIEGVAGCVCSPKLDESGRMALVQITTDVIQLIVCEDRIVPRIRSDSSGNLGIVVTS